MKQYSIDPGMGIKSKIVIVVLVLLIAVSVGVVLVLSRRPVNSNIATNQSNNNLVTIENTVVENREIFASSSSKDIYKIRKDGKWVIVMDGQESPLFDQVSNPTFSLDGQQFAYSAYINNQTYLVVNNLPKALPYDQIISIIFSPDGVKVAYVAEKGQEYVVVVDNQESKAYPKIGNQGISDEDIYIIFSPDSQNIAYEVVTDNGSFIVVNNQEGNTYDSVGNFSFSEDSSQYSYQASNGDEQNITINETVVIPGAQADSTNADSTPNSSAGPSTPAANNPISTNNTNSSNSSSTSGSTGSRRNVPLTRISEEENSAYYQLCSGSSAVTDCRR